MSSTLNCTATGDTNLQVADELAYTAHDLGSSLQPGMITPQMLDDIALREILTKAYNWTGPMLQDLERHRMVRKLVGLIVTGIIHNTDPVFENAE